MSTIAESLQDILQQIRVAEITFHQAPNSVMLLAASKGQSLEKIHTALQAGQIRFGENYLQEALQKILHVPQAEWHFIGPIQSNKTRKIAENFSWVHSVADAKIAKRLNDQRPDHALPLNICLEVNISNEPAKAGVSVEQVEALADYCRSLPRLCLRGLMAIPAAKASFDEQRVEFHKLRVLFDRLKAKNFQLDTLSMGMSGDFRAAIAEGATMIRVGTAIFGNRHR